MAPKKKAATQQQTTAPKEIKFMRLQLKAVSCVEVPQSLLRLPFSQEQDSSAWEAVAYVSSSELKRVGEWNVGLWKVTERKEKKRRSRGMSRRKAAGGEERCERRSEKRR